MTIVTIKKWLSQTVSMRHTLRGKTLQILVWPMVCLVAVALVWGAVFVTLKTDKNLQEKESLGDVAALSKVVAKGVSRSIDRLDLISKSIQYQWETGRDIGSLTRLVQGSTVLQHPVTFVGIFDRNGNAVKLPQSIGKVTNVTDEEYFRFHRTHPTRELHIGSQTTGRITGLPVVRFTRRLDAPDGSFDGVVVLSILPSYLTDFYDEAGFGKQGYLGINGKDGELYAASIGHVPVTKSMLNTGPLFGAGAGTRLLKNGAESFGDSEPRLVAWQALTSYPLFVVVARPEAEMLAPYTTMATAFTNGAIVVTLFLFLSALAGALVSIRLVRRRQQAQEIRDAYRLATEGAAEGFYFVRALYDDTGNIVDFLIEDCNESGAAIGGSSRDQIIGQRISAFFNVSGLILPAELPKQLAILRRTMADGLLYEDEWEAAPASLFRGLWLYRRLVRMGNGLAVTLRDISAAKAHEKKLLSMAHEDALTKLPNRHWLMNFLPEAFERARQNQTMLALFFIDIDNFKRVNDTLGHAAGDALLKIAALRLKSELRPGDSLARLGGDEFTIVLERVSDTTEVRHVATRIVEAFKHPAELGAHKVMVGTSIGISLFPLDGDNVDTLFKHADIAMYAAKAAGKSRYCFFEPKQYQALITRINNETALQHGVQQDQFLLYYQPRVSSQTGEICGIEALLRWQHPVAGILAPKEFMELAEATGLIIPLGAMAMDKACAQIALWSAMHLPMVPVSVNVSAFEFNKDDVKNHLMLCIARHHISPQSIEIELTETMVVDGTTETMNELMAIRALGVRLLVDDFGTGYSSLSQLQRVEMDVLKVDQSFTAELGRTIKAETFFKAIVSMAHALGMGVVAEGVETLQQLQILQSLGCNELQGYYISAPVPAEEMGALMRKRFLMTSAGVPL